MKRVKKLLAIVLTLALMLPFISDAVVLRGHAEEVTTLKWDFVECKLVSQENPSLYDAIYNVKNDTEEPILNIVYKLDKTIGLISVNIPAGDSAQVTVPYYTNNYGGGTVDCTFYPQTIDTRIQDISFTVGQQEASDSISFQNTVSNQFRYDIS